MTATGILVWSERPALAGALLGEARRLADSLGCEVGVCVGGETGSDEADAYAKSGADVVYVTGPLERDAAGWAAALGAVIAAAPPRLVLIGGTKTGLEVAPRVAERCRAAYAAWAGARLTCDPSLPRESPSTISGSSTAAGATVSRTMTPTPTVTAT